MEQSGNVRPGAHENVTDLAGRRPVPAPDPSDAANRDLSGYHPSVAAVLQYFTWEHLPAHLQPTSRAIGVLAFEMADSIPPSPQLTIGLNRLMDAKDSLVRATLTPADHGRRA